jgi:hypothetical protein
MICEGERLYKADKGIYKITWDCIRGLSQRSKCHNRKYTPTYHPPPENRLIQAIESLIDLVTYLARQGPHSSVLVRKIHGVCLAKNINCGSEWLMILC